MPPGKSIFARNQDGFTILEMIVGVTILVLLLSMMVGVLSQTSSTIRWSSARADTFSTARSSFDLLSQRLSQATLNTYWDYDSPTAPSRYLRQSDLQFLIRQNTQERPYGQEVFFQSPQGYSPSASYQAASGLLNACSFRVRYGSDDGFRPATTSSPRWRYRLMQSLQPAEQLQIFSDRAGDNPPWVQSTASAELPLADNIIAMIVWPRLPTDEDPTGETLTQDYQYDSYDNALSSPQPVTANQLPPILQVTLVAISESAALQYDTRSSTPPAEIEAALAGKFQSVASYQSDLDELSRALSEKNITHQILNTSVVMRESKWSP